MTSIIRLKRQRDEDPIESLMVTCKRFKHDGELQTTCQLTFAGTAKSENDCVRVMKKALHFEALDSFYVCSKPDEKPIQVPKRGTKRARPADDIEVVSSIGAQNLENLFQSKRAKLSVESNSKFRLLDVEKKKNDKALENCVYDIFYVKDPSVAEASLDFINFYVYCEDICDEESEDEETREEIKLEMNYFDDDVEEENYWTKDYPDEFNVFYQEDEDEDEDADDDDEKDEESRFCKVVQDMYLENDYGDYIYDFANSIIKSLKKKEKKDKHRKSTRPRKTSSGESVTD